MPEPEHLKAIRQEIDYNAAELKKIVDAPAFKKLFGAFREQEKLKIIPKNYAADHEDIELLKLKSFIAYKDLPDAALQKADAVKQVADICREIYPLNVYLTNALN